MKYDYNHKTVYVGIDVHKKTYSVVILCDGERVKQDTLKALPETLIGYLNKYFAGAEIFSVYEAGFSGFYLHRALLKAGIHNIVVNAGHIEVSARDRVKTDKRDAKKLASQLSAGRLQAIYVPDERREQMRELTRMRDGLSKDKKRVGNQIKSLLYKYGFILPDDVRKVSRRWVIEIARHEYSPAIDYRMKDFVQRWLDLDERIKKLDKALAEQALEDGATEQIYRSAPGIGPVHARVLANELGDLSQFSSEKKLSCFTGLTPSEYSSGEQRRLGHISRQGRSMIRHTLIQAAWVAVGVDKELKLLFEALALRVGKKKAILGIARRLICRLRTCFKTGMLYESRCVDERVVA